MKAIVLVGGEGTRMRPLTYTTPKPLLPIANVAFLERQLHWLASFGVDEVVLSMGYLPDAFHAHFPKQRFGKVRLRYAVEEKPLGTAGGIRFAAEGIDDRFVVCNGDILTALDLGAMTRFHEAKGAEASIYLCRVDDPSAFGVVPTRESGEVVGFIEKPPRDQAPTDWINAGIYILEPSVLDRIPPRMSVSIERETFPRMVATRAALYAFRHDGYWLDIGTPQKYLQAHADILGGALGPLSSPGAREIAAGVWAQDAARVAPDADMVGPVLLGRGVSVCAGATVTQSVLGDGVTVGEGARIVRSVIFAGATVEAGAAVIDSVLGTDAVLRARALLADVSIVGSAVEIPAGARMSGARVPGEDSPTELPAEPANGKADH